MKEKFNSEEARKNLLARERKEKEKREKERKAILQKVIDVLQKEFKGSNVEVYLVGSIVQPFQFSSDSDVDIVLKNYQEDRFDLWTKLEGQIKRDVEIILFETCHFQEFVVKEGFKVL